MCLCSIRRSDRYRCLNNIPNYKSALFKDLNDEQEARELPGRFSDLNDQCRRAFGVNFEYCKDLSHGVKTSLAGPLIRCSFTLAEVHSSLLPRNVLEYVVVYHQSRPLVGRDALLRAAIRHQSKNRLTLRAKGSNRRSQRESKSIFQSAAINVGLRSVITDCRRCRGSFP